MQTSGAAYVPGQGVELLVLRSLRELSAERGAVPAGLRARSGAESSAHLSARCPELARATELPDAAKLPGAAELSGAAKLSGVAKLPGTAELAGAAELPRTAELPGAAELPGTGELLARTAKLARTCRAAELPHWGTELTRQHPKMATGHTEWLAVWLGKLLGELRLLLQQLRKVRLLLK